MQEVAFSGGTSRGTRGKHEGVEERQSDAGTLSSCPDCLSLSRAGARKDIGYEKKRTLMQNISRMTTKALPRVPTSYRCHFRSLDKTQALLLTSGLKKPSCILVLPTHWALKISATSWQDSWWEGTHGPPLGPPPWLSSRFCAFSSSSSMERSLLTSGDERPGQHKGA